MMLLADLGNTRGKLVHSQQGKRTFIGYWDYADAPSLLLKAHKKTTLIYASVTEKSRSATLEQACILQNIEPIELKSSSYACGVKSGYDNPEQLGVDRWLALIGARTMEKGACIVVDAGTALTLDMMDESGNHLGGWIIPGLELMTGSLLQKAPLLTQSSKATASEFAHNTALAIGNGALAAAAGAILQAVHVAQQTLPLKHSPRLILTGGAAEPMQRALPLRCQVESELIFIGMEALLKERKNAELDEA